MLSVVCLIPYNISGVVFSTRKKQQQKTTQVIAILQHPHPVQLAFMMSAGTAARRFVT